MSLAAAVRRISFLIIATLILSFSYLNLFAATVPPAPIVSSQSITCGTTRVLFQIPAVTTATGYKIYRADGTSSTYKLLLATSTPSILDYNAPGSGFPVGYTTSYKLGFFVDTPLVQGKYSYKITATNSTGESVGGIKSVTNNTACQPKLVPSCVVTSPVASRVTGKSVGWAASATGGTGTYTYTWKGDGTVTGYNSNASAIYSQPGTVTAIVTAASGLQVVSGSCTTNITQGDVPPPSSVKIEYATLVPGTSSAKCDSDLKVSWPVVLNASGYNVYRSTALVDIWTGKTTYNSERVKVASGTSETQHLEKTQNLFSNKFYYYEIKSIAGGLFSQSYSTTSRALSRSPSCNPLSISASLDKPSPKEGEPVVWTAKAQGGVPPYTYTFSGTLLGTGDDIRAFGSVTTFVSSSSVSIPVTYMTPGYRSGKITVASNDGQNVIFPAGSQAYEATVTAVGIYAPQNAAAQTASVCGGKVRLTWSAATGATGYTIYRSTVLDGTYSAVKSNFSGVDFTDVSGQLTPGIIYFYKVSALANAKESAKSAAVSAKSSQQCLPPPSTIEAGSLDRCTPEIYVAWSSVPEAEKYNVYKSETPTETFIKMGTSTTETSFFDGDAVGGKTYYYKVSSVAGNDESDPSSTVSFTASGGICLSEDKRVYDLDVPGDAKEIHSAAFWQERNELPPTIVLHSLNDYGKHRILFSERPSPTEQLIKAPLNIDGEWSHDQSDPTVGDFIYLYGPDNTKPLEDAVLYQVINPTQGNLSSYAWGLPENADFPLSDYKYDSDLFRVTYLFKSMEEAESGQVGQNTAYPIGFSLDELMKLYWKAKDWKIDLDLSMIEKNTQTSPPDIGSNTIVQTTTWTGTMHTNQSSLNNNEIADESLLAYRGAIGLGGGSGSGYFHSTLKQVVADDESHADYDFNTSHSGGATISLFSGSGGPEVKKVGNLYYPGIGGGIEVNNNAYWGFTATAPYTPNAHIDDVSDTPAYASAYLDGREFKIGYSGALVQPYFDQNRNLNLDFKVVPIEYFTYGGKYSASTGERVNDEVLASNVSTGDSFLGRIFGKIFSALSSSVSKLANIINPLVKKIGFNTEMVRKESQTAALLNSKERAANFNIRGVEYHHFGGCEDVKVNAGDRTVLSRDSETGLINKIVYSTQILSGQPLKYPLDKQIRIAPGQDPRPCGDPNGGTGYDDVSAITNIPLRVYQPLIQYYAAYPPNEIKVKIKGTVYTKRILDNGPKTMNMMLNSELKDYCMVVENPKTQKKLKLDMIDRGPRIKDGIGLSNAAIEHLGLEANSFVNATLEAKISGTPCNERSQYLPTK